MNRTKMKVQRILGIDMGVNSAITYSIYKQFGDSFKFQIDKTEPGWSWINEWIIRGSHYTVDLADRSKATVIAIERLNFSNLKYRKFLKLLSHEIQTIAKKRFQVELVDPRYTSLRCRECGYIAHQNRLCSECFSCIKCGYTENADVNAAKNIAISCAIKFAKENIKLNLPWKKRFYILETSYIINTPVEDIEWAVKDIISKQNLTI